ncbi:plantaricin C family lantibiotic [Lactobacillus sp. AN1001]|jgi:hypothetical protein|uniref:plantaricin C family lantibiotic n=1 Tax=Ligilactobacillus animalis TaxID=1605 RepID=UPI003512AD8C
MENLKKSGLHDDFLKLIDDTEKVELTSGASGWTGVAKSIVSCSVASFILGNKGWVCTWTVECQSTCK